MKCMCLELVDVYSVGYLKHLPAASVLKVLKGKEGFAFSYS